MPADTDLFLFASLVPNLGSGYMMVPDGSVREIKVPAPNAAAAARLWAFENQAFKTYPKNCSGAVSFLIRNLVDPNFGTQLANPIAKGLTSGKLKWRRVTSNVEMQALANAGILVVGALYEPQNGHVLAVAPGQMKYHGGYSAYGSFLAVNSRDGMFPLAMSTSLGSWPGALSNGDKTVRDAFRADQWPNVTFWTPQ
jgi:hypothetical protein